MQLFYFPDIDANSESFHFDKDESRHIVKVLRKVPGDKLLITNGKGFFFEAEIAIASESRCQVRIIRCDASEAKRYRLHMLVAPTKMNERFEWFLEKAAEIGIDRITPVICERSERRVIKTDRMQKILVSAMKQSGQSWLPQLDEALDFRDLMRSDLSGQKFIGHCMDDQPRRSLKEQLQTGGEVCILIGPEGDFTPKEVRLALDRDFIPVSLGQTRLRTETAALVAVHSVAFTNET